MPLRPAGNSVRIYKKLRVSREVQGDSASIGRSDPDSAVFQGSERHPVGVQGGLCRPAVRDLEAESDRDRRLAVENRVTGIVHRRLGERDQADRRRGPGTSMPPGRATGVVPVTRP